jgi:DNA-binding PadR family transcriptional regulator
MADGIERLVTVIRSSKIKQAALKSLSRSMRTAAKIAARTDFRASHITVALKDLKCHKAVQIVNPYDKKPDIYQITDLGRRALKHLSAPITKKQKKRRKEFRRSGKRRSIS